MFHPDKWWVFLVLRQLMSCAFSGVSYIKCLDKAGLDMSLNRNQLSWNLRHNYFWLLNGMNYPIGCLFGYGLDVLDGLNDILFWQAYHPGRQWLLVTLALM